MSFNVIKTVEYSTILQIRFQITGSFLADGQTYEAYNWMSTFRLEVITSQHQRIV